jgi:hypothetical protein
MAGREEGRLWHGRMRIFSDREVLYHVSKLHSDYMSGASLSRAPLQIFLSLDFVGLHNNDICRWHFQQSSLMQHVQLFTILWGSFSLERLCPQNVHMNMNVQRLSVNWIWVFAKHLNCNNILQNDCGLKLDVYVLIEPSAYNTSPTYSFAYCFSPTFTIPILNIFHNPCKALDNQKNPPNYISLLFLKIEYKQHLHQTEKSTYSWAFCITFLKFTILLTSN